MSDLWVLLPLGMVVGFIAGLFGIGGGALMVPALTAYFLWQGFDVTVVVHLALATSMSCIVINAMLSIWTHQQHQAILWHITARMSPFIIMGSLLATWYVIQLASQTIALIFMLLMVVVALHMVFDFSPKYPSRSVHWLFLSFDCHWWRIFDRAVFDLAPHQHQTSHSHSRQYWLTLGGRWQFGVCLLT